MFEPRIKDDIQSDVQALRNDLTAVRRDFAELTKGLVEAGQHTVSDLNDRMQREMKHKAHLIKDAGHQAVDYTRHQIEERPLISVTGAFAAGIILGAVLMHSRG